MAALSRFFFTQACYNLQMVHELFLCCSADEEDRGIPVMIT